MNDIHVIFLNGIQDDVILHSKASYAGIQIKTRAALTARQRRTGHLKSGDYLRPPAFALFSHGKRLTHRIFGPSQAAAGNRVEDEGFLIGGKLNFHALNVGGSQLGVNWSAVYQAL